MEHLHFRADSRKLLRSNLRNAIINGNVLVQLGDNTMWHNRFCGKCLMVLFSLFLLTGCAKENEAKKQYDEGLASFNENKWEEAIESFGNALLEETEGNKQSKSEQILNKKACYGMGVAYYKIQNYEKAEKYLEEALSISYLDNWDEEIKKYQVDTLCELDEYEKAYDVILSLREDKKEDFSLLFQEYFILDALGKEDEKEELLKEGRSIKGNGDEYQFNQAKINYFLGNLKEAKEGMKVASENEITEALFYLGRIYEDSQKYEKSISYYEAYNSAREAENDFVNLHIAVCYEKSGDYATALNVYESAIKNSDGSYLKELRYNQIVTLEKNTQYKEAFEKCSAYMKDYEEDDTMKKEYEFLETRVQ